ncbi:MAG TPA: phosphatidylserine decarboxylase family protein [Gemmatimonadales bacterium]|nr:phosphatidylserine decarboxylase family protein [Gemmatimonadales bacterium]
MIRTAPEGRWFIAGAWAIAIALVIVAVRAGSTLWWIVAVGWLAISVWVVAFFRDPERAWSISERLVVAPADGKVVSVLEADEPAFHGGRALRISIFMNVFDCHVNRYPVGGTIAYRHYNHGTFGHAAAEKSSLDNEQASVGVAAARGKVLVRQIAGLVARRIVTDHEVGASVRQAERLGMIRFGSRVDLFLPVGTRTLVRTGDTTLAGVTVVAEWS